MRDLRKEPHFDCKDSVEEMSKELYGIDPEMNLLSVNFATTENPLLNEQYEVESTDTEI